MDSEAKQKLFEMHGTVQRLDQKTDDIMQTQGEHKADLRNINEELDNVEERTNHNRRRIHAIYILGGVASTVLIIASQFYTF